MTTEERTPTRIGAREEWLRELLGEVAEEADTKRDGVRPIVVRLTGDATKDAAASAQSRLFFSAREPIRQAANTTMATTAGLMPLNTPCTKVRSPKAR